MAEAIRLRSLLFVPGDRPERMEKALASGAACFLKKPFEMDELIACLEDALSPDGARDRDSR